MIGPKLDARSYAILILALLGIVAGGSLIAQQTQSTFQSTQELASATQAVAQATNRVADSNAQIADAIRELASATREGARASATGAESTARTGGRSAQDDASQAPTTDGQDLEMISPGDPENQNAQNKGVFEIRR